MSIEIWATIIGVALATILAAFGYLGRSYMAVMHASTTSAHLEAASAKDKAHMLEVALLENKAKFAESMRQIEVTFLDYKLYVSNEYVKRGDHTAILGEIFRKLEVLTVSVENKMESIGRKLDNKQDRISRRVDDEGRN